MSDVFTHPWLSGLFEDPETAALLGAEATLAHMLVIEDAYATALAATGRVPVEIAEQIRTHLAQAKPDVSHLKEGTGQDGVVVPALIRELRAGLPERAQSALHSGMTSQDVIDTALVISLGSVCDLFEHRLLGIVDQLEELKSSHSANQLMGRTRMQAALPISTTHRIASWRKPLNKHLKALAAIRSDIACLQLGGAVGDGQVWGADRDAIAKHMGKALGLQASGVWHTDRSNIANFANWLALVTGSLGKFGQDIALMAQQGMDDVTLKSGGGSSAMPHKQNPIQAELLVTLARYNAVQVSGMHQAIVHEQERSGSAWTLEWMILPQMVMTTGRSLLSAAQVISQIDAIGRA